MKLLIPLLVALSVSSCKSQNQLQNTITKELNENEEARLEVLLVGTSHWNTYEVKGTDVAQTKQIDILSEEYQLQLREITKKIAEFNPDKIFVERVPSRQDEIDSLYNLYRTTEWGNTRRNEIYQMGFRTAANLNHKKVHCIDNRDTEFPADSVFAIAQQSGQAELLMKFQEKIATLENEYNELVERKATLSEILKNSNSKEHNRENIGLYVNLVNKVGNDDNYVGSYLTSEWYKRNFNILSNIQRRVEKADKRIMILMGSGHTSLLADYIEYLPDWNLVKFEDIIE